MKKQAPSKILFRIYYLWTKANNLKDKQLPKKEKEELRKYLEEYGDDIVKKAKEEVELQKGGNDERKRQRIYRVSERS